MRIGKVFKIAKSVSILADADFLEALLRSQGVKTILLTQAKDILPRPLGPLQ